jgi:hypothetical protein
VDEHFGIAAGREPVSRLDKLAAEPLEIPDFSVVNGPDRSVLVRHGLCAAVEVDDA